MPHSEPSCDHLRMLRERQDVSSATKLSEDCFEVEDDVGDCNIGTFDETVAWLDAGLATED